MDVGAVGVLGHCQGWRLAARSPWDQLASSCSDRGKMMGRFGLKKMLWWREP